MPLVKSDKVNFIYSLISQIPIFPQGALQPEQCTVCPYTLDFNHLTVEKWKKAQEEQLRRDPSPRMDICVIDAMCAK